MKKANYARLGTELHLRWEFNRFVCLDPPVSPRTSSDLGRSDKARRVFKKLLMWHLNTGKPVSGHNSRAGNYAPRVFTAMGKDFREG